jgi:hypothetical protein
VALTSRGTSRSASADDNRPAVKSVEYFIAAILAVHTRCEDGRNIGCAPGVAVGVLTRQTLGMRLRAGSLFDIRVYDKEKQNKREERCTSEKMQ